MNSFLVVLKKELTDIFRDRKTLIFTILLPILIYPAMFKIIDSSIEDTKKQVQSNLTIAYEGDKASSIYGAIKGIDNIKIQDGANSEEMLKKGDVSLIIKVPEGFDSDVQKGNKIDIGIIYDENSNKSTLASSMLRDLFDKYSKQIVDGRLKEKGIDSSILTPFEVKQESLNKDGSNGMGAVLLNMLPTIIVIFMLSPTIGIAADLVAGEKERGTFEPLLSTAISRTAIFWGKLVAIATVALVALTFSIGSMVVSMTRIMNSTGSVSIPPEAFIVVGGISIFVLVALCALEISISIYARSMKEANTYLGGLLMPVMILTYIPFMMDSKSIAFKFFNIPIVNAVVVMKEAMAGIFNPMHIAIVLVWHVVYVVAAVIFAKYMFSKESVVFRT